MKKAYVESELWSLAQVHEQTFEQEERNEIGENRRKNGLLLQRGGGA